MVEHHQYPRCALVVKNVEVRDENDNLIGHNSHGAVTPQEMISFIETLLTAQREEIENKITKYIVENRDKVERIDRYVLDELLSTLNQ